MDRRATPRPTSSTATHASSGLATTPHRLVGALDEEVARREELLDAREREIIENHLVSGVASHLSRLIGDAEDTVAAMNAELEVRPTSTGMVLRLRWRPDEDAGPSGGRLASGCARSR